MLNVGPAKKVTIYVGHDHRFHGESVYTAILDFLFFHKVAGASVTRGIAGFGADHHMHSDQSEILMGNLPVKVEFVETPEKVEEILPKLRELAGTGLIEIQDTTIVKPSGVSTKDSRAQSAPPLKRQGKAKLMRIFIGENDRWHDKPLHKALVECMRTNEIAGVTVYQGILGYGANRRIHKDSALHLSHDRPVMLTVVDSEEKLQAFLPVLDEMVQQGLVVLSDVDIIKYTHDFATAERRKEVRP
jgi:PII-like signaling protein